MAGTCVSGSGLSIVDGALTLDATVMAPAQAWSTVFQGSSRTFSDTVSPGDFNVASVSKIVDNPLPVPAIMIATVSIGKTRVELAGRNRGYVSVKCGLNSGGDPSGYTRYMCGATNDNGTHPKAFAGYWPNFTQTDVEHTPVELVLTDEYAGLPLPPGGSIRFAASVHWNTVFWYNKAVKYDSRCAVLFPEIRATVFAFPQAA